jgi:protein SCO1/2
VLADLPHLWPLDSSALKSRCSAALRVVLAALLGTALCGCSRAPPYNLQSISGLMPRLEFQLTDDDARPVSADNYRGDVVLMYFGYTHCPDVCPTTLAALGQALGRLGADASKVKVLFVTVDPARDTAPLLKLYMSYFGPQFIGLRGDDDALRPLIRRYRVAYHRDPPDQNGNYAVEHSSVVLVFDQRGEARLLAREGDPPESVAQDLRRLINSR